MPGLGNLAESLDKQTRNGYVIFLTCIVLVVFVELLWLRFKKVCDFDKVKYGNLVLSLTGIVVAVLVCIAVFFNGRRLERYVSGKTK